MKRAQILSILVLAGMVSSIVMGTAIASGSVSDILIAKGDRELDVDGVPRSVQRAAIAELSRRENIPERDIRIVEATRKNWPDPCLGLPRPDELCAQVLTEGWRLVLTDGSDRWVYRTNDNGSTVRLESAPTSSSSGLPRSVADAVLDAVSRRVGTSESNFRIVKAVRQTWPNGCLGIPQSGQVCTQALVEGWEVTVVSDRNPQQRWIYRTDSTGRLVLLADAYDAQSGLPRSVADAVLRDISVRQQQPVNAFQITQAERKVWPDTCLGAYIPYNACAQREIPGWQVSVSSRQQQNQVWVYHTDESGNSVRLNEYNDPNLEGVLNPTQIPANEMPQPLTQGMVFRAISSGGIAGRTYETVLMEDGTLIQVLQGLGNANDVGRRVGRISPRQVQQFQRLLSQQQFDRFNRLNSPAPNGSADYITVMLSSPSSTIRYADITQEQLPENLQQVVQAWNRIAGRIGR